MSVCVVFFVCDDVCANRDSAITGGLREAKLADFLSAYNQSPAEMSKPEGDGKGVPPVGSYRNIRGCVFEDRRK